jgi:hypothetical protein
MSQEHFLHLQHSETTVARMAADLLAAYIHTGKLDEQNQDALIAQCLDLASRLALGAEKMVKSDEEWVKKNQDTAYLLG